ncbi:MAG: glucose-6-phosphate isomerase [Candidatus Tokpelaia sp. JSC085]|nr:MAG: glucose-6-phosphate isomerase [Candidatus Tokpelaia sp. JSC085]
MSRDEVQFQSILQELKRHARDDAPFDIKHAFADDSRRFDTFSLVFDDLLFDFSKCAVNIKTLQQLEKLAYAADVPGQRDAMFAGDPVNVTENRAALHVALRAPKESQFFLDDRNIVPDIQSVLIRMEKFSGEIRRGTRTTANGDRFTDIVNIGIGGSNLGPIMAINALKPYHDGPRCHFISNIDGAHVSDVLGSLDPKTTLVIVSSKTFTTRETITNALYARRWIADALGEESVEKHFAAVSSALGKVADFGIDQSYTFGFWDWVGGRYSIWASVGLPLMLAVGPQQFRLFLAGAHEMDEHFRHTHVSINIPIMLGLLGFWYRVICNYPTRSIIPYEQRLLHLPAYLQQLDMESNGKCVTLDGSAVSTPTGPVVWGEPGTDGQHAFFQFLHQGTDITPVELIIFINAHEPNLQSQHNMLLANCLAQTEALLYGCSYETSYKKLISSGIDVAEAKKLAPHKTFPGNRPSITIMQKLLTPYALGRLLALYEHRVVVEGILMNINSFDQWGVELGKELAATLLPVVAGKEEAGLHHDGSTLGLLAHINAYRREQ